MKYKKIAIVNPENTGPMLLKALQIYLSLEKEKTPDQRQPVEVG